MLSYIISILLLFLVLTIIIELGVWKILSLIFKTYKARNWEMIAWSIIAINVATNPAFNIISMMIDSTRDRMFLEFGLDILIIFVEAGLLYLIYRKEFSKLLWLSTAMNVASYGIGLLLFRPNWWIN